MYDSSTAFAIILFIVLFGGLATRSSIGAMVIGVVTVVMGFWLPWMANELGTHKGQLYINICSTAGLVLLFIGAIVHHLNHGWPSSEA